MKLVIIKECRDSFNDPVPPGTVLNHDYYEVFCGYPGYWGDTGQCEPFFKTEDLKKLSESGHIGFTASPKEVELKIEDDIQTAQIDQVVVEFKNK